ncbi:MAG: sigma-70 family RNA polymerase sigma factor [Pontiellaceae bacterium]|nr:sigma-70 family RNA polymerase sigma factor [Pontiellaceae bacterium]
MQINTETKSIEETIQAAQKGDLQAFGEVVKTYEPMLRAFALYRLPYPNEAAEAVQDTFVRAHEQLAEFRSGADFGAWLRSICRYMILSRVKSYTRRKVKHDDYKSQIAAIAVQHLATAEEPDGDHLLTHLNQCREGLSETNQSLIRDRYTQALSIQQISEKTGRTETWVTSTLHRVRSALRTCIEKRIKEPSDEYEYSQ